MMNYKKLEKNQLIDCSREEFIDCWHRRYNDSVETLYYDNIDHKYNHERIMLLYEWKNGGKISEDKTKSIKNNYLTKIDVSKNIFIKNANNRCNGLHFLKELGGGEIWSIFFVHILDPKNFSIFDQHVRRAMYFLLGNPDLYPENTNRLNIYENEFLPFWDEYVGSDDPSNRRLDQALFAFGKYIKPKGKITTQQPQTFCNPVANNTNKPSLYSGFKQYCKDNFSQGNSYFSDIKALGRTFYNDEMYFFNNITTEESINAEIKKIESNPKQPIKKKMEIWVVE